MGFLLVRFLLVRAAAVRVAMRLSLFPRASFPRASTSLRRGVPGLFVPSLLASGLALLVACSAAPANEPQHPSSASSVAGAAATGSGDSTAAAGANAGSPAADASTPAGGTSHVAEPAAASDGACPSDMQLVDGEYCTEVEHQCKKSWYDTSNRKTICEEFEPHSECKGERVKKRYCMDSFSWPNVKGERPEVMNNFYQAEVKCAAVGKRLCTESEWTLACEGPEMKPYPYGYVRDAKKCNGDQPWDSPNMSKVAARDPEELARLWRGVRNGSQPECVSDFGIADLPGNTDDVVASETYSEGYRGKFDSVHSGGPWYKGVRNQCRPKIYTHDEGFYYYFLGFRCCSEPDGAATDPRTPKQRKQNWKMDHVERLARFTVAQMKEKLELKKKGECQCAPNNVLCKTMCGTLLGPGAQDVHP